MGPFFYGGFMKANTQEALHEKAQAMLCCHDVKGDLTCTRDCMAWRERKQVQSSGQNRTARTIYIGWCGLAGQPADEWNMTEEEAGA